MSYSWACEVSTEDVDRTLSNSGDDAAEAASFVLELFTPDDIFSLDVEAAEPLFAAFAGVPEVLVPDVLLADVLAPVVVRFEAAPVAPFAVGALAEEADFFAFVEAVEADLAECPSQHCWQQCSSLGWSSPLKIWMLRCSSRKKASQM